MDIVNRTQVLKLLAECNEVKDKLTSNELEMYTLIKKKYAASDEGTFDDKICLEVMLRNTQIRESYNMDKNEATRQIDFKSSKDRE